MDTATVSPSTLSKRGRIGCATYSLAEFASMIGVSYTTAHLMAQAGTLPVEPVKVGRQYLFPKAAVHRLLEIDSEPLDAA